MTGTTDYSGFRRADLVIEAVFEDLAVKRNVIKELEDIVREDTVIATNTSALPIWQVAKNAMHPERIVGMHFFSPVHRMPLVEVVRPDKADPRALARVVAEAQAMGKTAIVVRDTPGFYTTRVLGFMLAEAMLLLDEGARIEDVDRAMVAFGWPIGPLERAATHPPLRERGGALPRRRRAAIGGRGRPRRGHGGRVPAVPRRPVPLGRFRRCRAAR